MWILIVVLVVAIIAAVAIGQQQQQPTTQPGAAQAPVAKEGVAIRKVYGTVWIDAAQVLGFKPIGTDRIIQKGSGK